MLFKFSILCVHSEVSFGPYVLLCSLFLSVGFVASVIAKRLTGKNFSKVTYMYFVSGGT